MKELKGLGDEAGDVRAEYKRRGGNLDRVNGELLCRALTAVEDAAEVRARGAMTRERLRLRGARRS